jgi:hypothetical protein
VIEQTQKYTTPRCESSRRGEISRAVVLVREASRLLKNKATHLPDSSPGTRLQKIATGLGDFSNSLERAANAIELGRRHPTRDAKRLFSPVGDDSLSKIERRIASSLRAIPIGSTQASQLRALQSRLRTETQERLTSPLEKDAEHIGSIVARVLSELAGELSTRGAA